MNLQDNSKNMRQFSTAKQSPPSLLFPSSLSSDDAKADD